MSNDYIMRQIEDMTRFLASVIFARKLDAFSIISEDGSVAQSDLVQMRLNTLVRQGKINEAENLLFETIEADPAEGYLPCALDFYEQVNALDDAALARCNYSRQEIAEGMAAVRRRLLPHYAEENTNER